MMKGAVVRDVKDHVQAPDIHHPVDHRLVGQLQKVARVGIGIGIEIDGKS